MKIINICLFLEIIFFIQIVDICCFQDQQQQQMDISDNRLAELVDKLKDELPKIENLYLRNQMSVLLYAEKYASKDGFVAREDIRDILKRVFLPIKKGILPDWMEENIMEKIHETMKNIEESMYDLKKFRKFILKLSPKDFLGRVIWNKVKDLKYSDISEQYKSDL